MFLLNRKVFCSHIDVVLEELKINEPYFSDNSASISRVMFMDMATLDNLQQHSLLLCLTKPTLPAMDMKGSPVILDVCRQHVGSEVESLPKNNLIIITCNLGNFTNTD